MQNFFVFGRFDQLGNYEWLVMQVNGDLLIVLCRFFEGFFIIKVYLGFVFFVVIRIIVSWDSGYDDMLVSGSWLFLGLCFDVQVQSSLGNVGMI